MREFLIKYAIGGKIKSDIIIGRTAIDAVKQLYAAMEKKKVDKLDIRSITMSKPINSYRRR